MTTTDHLAFDRPAEGDRVSLWFDATVAHVALGAGVRRNALRTRDWARLETAARMIAQRTDVRVVVVRGVGGTFTAGSDLTEWVGADQTYVNETFLTMESALAAVEQIGAVTVAAVEGAAVGAGCELALACDLRLLAESAVIGMPVVQHGIRVSPLFAHRLVDAVGPTHARELLFTGRTVCGEQAERLGLATEVTADGAFEESLQSLVAALTAQPHEALIAAKRSVSRVAEADRARLRDHEWTYVDETVFFERISSFLARRPAGLRAAGALPIAGATARSSGDTG